MLHDSFLPSYDYTGDAMSTGIKRIILIPMILSCCMLLGGCARSVRSAADELCTAHWEALRDNGDRMELYFDGSSAFFSAENDDLTLVIKGVFAVDESSIMIIDDATDMSFRFAYRLHGDRVELTYRGSTVILDKL